MAGGQIFISWLHPCLTSNVALNMRTYAHGPLMGHPNWAGCDIHLPSNNPTSSCIQLTRPLPTHTSSRVPHPRSTHACICPHTDPSQCPWSFPLSTQPHVQCWPICHAVSRLRPTCTMHPMLAHWLASGGARIKIYLWRSTLILHIVIKYASRIIMWGAV
jgi:hypothetical protein